MKDPRRTLPLLGAAIAVATVSLLQMNHVRAAATVDADYYSALEAFGDVCIKSADPGEMLRKVRIKGWETLEDDTVPAVVRGNGAVRFAEVRRGQIEGRPVILAVGGSSGTSFCRVYFHAIDQAAMETRLRYVKVLGSPLSAPDFRGPLNFPEGWSAVGWHRSVGDQWRALHYSFDPDGQGPNAAWQSIEITRKA
ncbi:hypothetical protein [Caulobacter sp. RL271]|jgi:hypothetical protein|uniref:Uncharacterized protein n=1 Tax=Caulobacter segnis TaxID=88688 RepID=A0ABY4ZTK2_9CAUL|nr:hypothetical protein [Caulobacter segnis]USQ95534.1 hypothetical protein MZV50_23805 [Caulobacter segnis]